MSSLFLFLVLGCGASADIVEPSRAVTDAPEAEAAARAAVHHVVFVGREEACDCTKERVTTSWAALQEVVGDLPVERVDVDEHPKRVEELEALSVFVAAPAVYFLAEDGSLVDLIQGQLTVTMAREVLTP